MSSLITPSLISIDAPMLAFQAFYGVPDTFHDTQGRAVNAVFGFTSRLLDLLVLTHAPRFLFCWDESLGTGFRHRLYTPYKANRPLADNAFCFQLQKCAEIVSAFGLSQLASNEVEADDLIASAVSLQRSAGGQCLIVTQDKDLAQTIMPGDAWWPFPKDTPWDYTRLQAHWQIPLVNIADFLALSGDSVDNIPGIKGIGAVTAKALIQQFSTLECLYENLKEVAGLKLRGSSRVMQQLDRQREEAFLFRQLTRLQESAITDEVWKHLNNHQVNIEEIKKVLEACNLWSRTQKKVEKYFSQKKL